MREESKKNNLFGPNLQGELVSAPPGRGKVEFVYEIEEMWTVGVVNLFFDQKKKKGRKLFRGRKVYPQR